MAAMPSPMNNPLASRSGVDARARPIAKKLSPVTRTGIASDSKVRLRSYVTSMLGMLNASIATKCIAQMPPPIASAAVASQACRTHPKEARTRLARSSAV